MNFVTDKEIARKLYWQRQIWPEVPKILIEGEEGKFGKIVFEFSDGICSIGILLVNKQKILEMAQSAVSNFSEFVNEAYRD